MTRVAPARGRRARYSEEHPADCHPLKAIGGRRLRNTQRFLPYRLVLEYQKAIPQEHFPDFFPNFASDLRPRVTRPAPAGHATCARGSRDLRPRVAGNLRCRNRNPWHENGKVRPGNGFTPFSFPYRQGFVNESRMTGPDSRTPARCTRIDITRHHSLFTLHPICYAHH